LIRRYDISGVTRGLYFNVIFDVNESDLCIVNLGIKVNPNCRREIGKFIERVELDKNLHAFFKGFIEYARLNQQRTLLFNALRQKYLSLVVQATSSLDYSKYNDFVEDPLITYSSISSRVSPELTFLWYLNVTPFGHVHPTVQLFTRMPSQWTASDKNRLIDRIPYNFQMLVELKGIQIAIEVFVQCIFGHDN
ncbi:15852_t:CDS:2, partial [Acaulospora morrowiae]